MISKNIVELDALGNRMLNNKWMKRGVEE